MNQFFLQWWFASPGVGVDEWLDGGGDGFFLVAHGPALGVPDGPDLPSSGCSSMQIWSLHLVFGSMLTDGWGDVGVSCGCGGDVRHGTEDLMRRLLWTEWLKGD